MGDSIKVAGGTGKSLCHPRSPLQLGGCCLSKHTRPGWSPRSRGHTKEIQERGKWRQALLVGPDAKGRGPPSRTAVDIWPWGSAMAGGSSTHSGNRQQQPHPPTATPKLRALALYHPSRPPWTSGPGGLSLSADSRTTSCSQSSSHNSSLLLDRDQSLHGVPYLRHLRNHSQTEPWHSEDPGPRGLGEGEAACAPHPTFSLHPVLQLLLGEAPTFCAPRCALCLGTQSLDAGGRPRRGKGPGLGRCQGREPQALARKWVTGEEAGFQSQA